MVRAALIAAITRKDDNIAGARRLHMLCHVQRVLHCHASNHVWCCRLAPRNASLDITPPIGLTRRCSTAMATYYDIDAILTDAQKVPCTFELDVPGLGYLEGNPGQDVRS